jgi:TRAP-type C4-dicarboxylate transport system permease small subunit
MPETPQPPEPKSALQKIDDGWQKLEARLCAGVLVAEIASLTLWIALKGLSTDYKPGENTSGLVFRSIVTAAILGTIAHLATRKQAEKVHRGVTTVAVVVGVLAGRAWVHAGVEYSSNILNFLQNASTLMLIGGLRGLATRLTLWVALLGASLATSRGRHINVDVLVRYVPEKLRVPSALVGQVAAMLVCLFGAVGFADYIAISVYRADATQPCPDDKTKSCDTTTGSKVDTVLHDVGGDFFLLGRQISLDMSSWPTVLSGRRYDKWLTASRWNAWLDSANWKAHFEPAAVDALHMDPSQPDATRMPQVAVPGTGEQARGLLVRELDFVFPFGLIAIALKFLLRIVLILTGQVKVDLDSAHGDDELANAQERDHQAEVGAQAAKQVST